MKKLIAVLLAAFLIAATPARGTLGFADVAQLVGSHPLHAVLLEYDREIAALRATQNATGANRDRTAHAAQEVRRETQVAQRHVGRLASAGVSQNLARERGALDKVLNAQRAGGRALDAFADQLGRETAATYAAYQGAMSESNARAYAARAQQLHEKELTLAFDLARANGGKRLSLRLKLNDLHLTPSKRARLQAELSALDGRERQAVDAMRRRDAAILADYQAQLERESTAATASMAAQLRGKAQANLAARRNVARVNSTSAVALRALPAQMAAFGASTRIPSDAGDVMSGMQSARVDLPRRFEQLGAMDAHSAGETAAQIARLQQTRSALYRSIVADIVQDARTAAERRGVERIIFEGRRPAGSVDLTDAIRADLARR